MIRLQTEQGRLDRLGEPRKVDSENRLTSLNSDDSATDLD